MPKSKPSKEKNNFTVKKDKLKRYQFWSIFIWKLLFFLWSNYFLFCRMTFNWQKKKLFGKENWKQKTKKDFWINHTFSSRFLWLKKKIRLFSSLWNNKQYLGNDVSSPRRIIYKFWKRYDTKWKQLSHFFCLLPSCLF
jgi:hypothetical protein